MDNNLKATIDKIYLLTKQNTEFDTELRKRLNIVSANSAIKNDERIEHIYEYCIEHVIKEQAKDFYKDFPLEKIRSTLEQDFVRMEFFRRKDCFGDFCLALYQQIECITNTLCDMPELETTVSKMLDCNPYVKFEKGKETTIYNRATSNYSIAKLVLGQKKLDEKYSKKLKEQSAIDKIKIIVYFLGYKAQMLDRDYNTYREITELFYNIYQCRNENHRGSTTNEETQKVLNIVEPLKSFYYLKFMGALSQYIEYIKTGYTFLGDLLRYSQTILQPIKIEGTIKTLLPSGCFVSYNNNSKPLPLKLFEKVKGHKAGDPIIIHLLSEEITDITFPE